MIIRLFLISIIIICSCPVSAQELMVNFSINSNKIQGTNREVFNTMQESIQDLLNNGSWTNHIFEAEERIECNFMINLIEETTTNNYKATLSIQSRRPVYGTNYNTVMLNYIDEDFTFKYQEFDQVEFADNTFLSNLTSVLGYWIYFILALDYDSFQKDGGTPFYRKAEKVVTNAQGSGYTGWTGADSRNRKNRYWFMENALNSDYEDLREFMYRYHRLGLDKMEENVELGRAEIYECVLLLEKLYKEKPDPFMQFLRLVFDSKSDEIVRIFSEAPAEQKNKVYNALVTIDPSGSSKFEALK